MTTKVALLALVILFIAVALWKLGTKRKAEGKARELGQKFFDAASPEAKDPGYWKRRILAFLMKTMY